MSTGRLRRRQHQQCVTLYHWRVLSAIGLHSGPQSHSIGTCCHIYHHCNALRTCNLLQSLSNFQTKHASSLDSHAHKLRLDFRTTRWTPQISCTWLPGPGANGTERTDRLESVHGKDGRSAAAASPCKQYRTLTALALDGAYLCEVNHKSQPPRQASKAQLHTLGAQRPSG